MATGNAMEMGTTSNLNTGLVAADRRTTLWPPESPEGSSGGKQCSRYGRRRQKMGGSNAIVGRVLWHCLNAPGTCRRTIRALL
eukprot:Skav208630  [mRNA]  locus=scaffold3433:68533:72400:- [translate_table: standard]